MQEIPKYKILAMIQQRKCASFRFFTDSDLQKIAERVRRLDVEAGHVLMRHGESCKPFLIKRKDDKDEEKVVLLIGPYMYVVWTGVFSVYTEYKSDKGEVEKMQVATLNRCANF